MEKKSKEIEVDLLASAKSSTIFEDERSAVKKAVYIEVFDDIITNTEKDYLEMLTEEEDNEEHIGDTSV